jgi:hypothetical protein
MLHHTKTKGDIAVALTISDLTIKGYTCFTPIVSEHLPFDIIAYKDNKCYRIQCKYSKNGFISNRTTWSDKNGSHKKFYDNSDFDYYAVYIPNLNKILYPNIKYGGSILKFTPIKTAQSFYWYEDFYDFTDNAEKKCFKDFNIKLKFSVTQSVIDYRLSRRQTRRPTKEELEKLVWQYPLTKIASTLKVSDTTIKKWAKSYALDLPPRGYWLKNK